MKKEIRSDLTSKNKITDSINIVSKAVLAYEREPQKTEQQEDIKMKEVVVVSGVRLPVGSYGGSLKDITAIDMGAMVVKEAVKRAGIQPSDVDEVVIGQVGEVAENGFIARAVSLKAGMPKETTAYSVNRQCGSDFSLLQRLLWRFRQDRQMLLLQVYREHFQTSILCK